jgi:N-acetylglucosamine-6-phosphate deacetylase
MRSDEMIADSIAGFHIEGPFISPNDGPRGAHDPKFVRNPDFNEFLEWQEAADGYIKYITVAPETPGAIDFIERVVATGVKVAIGHSGASQELIHEAISSGATLSTHLGNGSAPQLPRLKNFIWEQLASDELTAGIICDGFHLPASVVKVIARTKGLDKLVLVSDVALLGGFPPGEYKWGDLDVDVFEDGHLGLHGTSILAGAAHLLDWDIMRFIQFTGMRLPDAIKLCTFNPAKALGLDCTEYVSFSIGNPVNFTVFNYQGDLERLQIEKVFHKGRMLFEKHTK